MGYLYINFLDNLERGSKSWDDFYTNSLTEQFDVIKRKLGYSTETLEQFMAMVFPPQTNKNYYISMPSFDRRARENYRGKQCVYNIVIRPEKDNYLSYAIPQNYDFIVIGDLTFGSVIDITVKGIEIIDTNVAKYGEQKVSCIAACAFSNKSFIAGGRNITVPDYGTRDIHDAVLTNDFVYSLCNDLYPIPNPKIAIKIFSEWQNYIKFRKYYLGKQSERCEAISNVIICNSFMITKEIYRRNEESYAPLLLDDVEQFSKGEQIILSNEVTGSDEFPLIRIDIEKNRKSILSDTVGKNGKGKPKYESHLQRYTHESMGISTAAPKYDEEGNLPKGFRFNQFLLGERYLFIYIDLPVDCSALDNKFKKDCFQANTETDSKFASIINNELTKFMAGQDPIVSAKYEKKLFIYKKELADSLVSDVSENKDLEVRREYETEINKRKSPLETEFKRKKDDVSVNIRKINESKLTKEEKEEKIGQLRKILADSELSFVSKIDSVKNGIDLKSFYVSRNTRLIEKKEKSLAIEMQAELDSIKKDRKSQLDVQYRGQIVSEKETQKAIIEKQYKIDKADKIEKETVRRYQIYFRPSDITDKINDIKKSIDSIEPNFLTYDNRAEKAKIERQEKALNSLLGGYVKNPFLPAYLFAPETLSQATHAAQKDPEWCLESLNDRQKLAVKRALASESLFLLQGPPGTGKTQVIAEITAQFTKQGKKVLISSETHKAIDNVFDRLPKIPEIRPLRLIPSQNGKETNYSPEKLVDNLYMNISGNLEKQVGRFEHFEDTKATFDSEMKNLRQEYDRLLRLKKDNAKIESERGHLVETINRLNMELEQVRAELTSVKETIELYRRTVKYIESYRFGNEGVIEKFIKFFRTKAEALLVSFPCFESVGIDKIGDLMKANVGAVRDELTKLLSEDKLIDLKNRQQKLRSILQSLRDPETDDAPDENNIKYAEYKEHQNELITVVSEIKEVQNNSSFDISSSIVFSLVPAITNNKILLKQLPENLTAFRIKLQSVISEIKKEIESETFRYTVDETNIIEKISDKQLEISDRKRRYEELGVNAGVEEFGELNSALKQKITRFFRDFNIVKEYDTENLETAFKIIADEWDVLEYDYKRTQVENKTKIPMFREICKYLAQEDILEEDRQAYTRELYNCANVFGITCTSRDRFTKSQLLELGKYGIASVDIRTQGIDVVIIDEVSKSSFLDLLIPILYGKTIILVGDHRQLPPMYDLRHMRKDDFEGLDETIINKEINDRYTDLYEECFFKTLYEKVPEDFRVMLNKQYRCHSHIMEVFNHFYGGNSKGLIVGKQQQDDEKEHNLTVRINGNTIIEPKHHIYFIDCDRKESSAYEGSTSKINEQEAEVAMGLLKELDKSSAELVKSGKFKVDKDKKIDERPSVGVICTYGDQAGLIKKKRKYQQFKGFSGKQDERLIISTVDDFQGDERDIIIVSMVRNPSGNRFDADFIKKFERINVAFSRARKMLIIVGSRKFLSEEGIIDLPDLTGNHSLDKINFHVYKEIIDTVYFRGRVLTANDILGD